MICPRAGLDGPGAVAVRQGRIVAAGPAVTGTAGEVVRFPDATLLPGLVDLHAHPGLPDSKYGVDPDAQLLPYGTTTVLSQGDAGADNWSAYRDAVVRPSRTRVFMALNLSPRGESSSMAASRPGRTSTWPPACGSPQGANRSGASR